MNKALPFVVGLIIGFVVMFVVQLLRKKKAFGYDKSLDQKPT